MSTQGIEQRDERDPPELLEQREEPEADEDEARELGGVRDDAHPGEVEDDPSDARERRDREQPVACPRASGSASQTVAVKAGKDEEARDRDRGRLPRARAGWPRPRRTRRGRRRAPRARVRAGARASVSTAAAPPTRAERLEGVPERRLRRLVVERLVDVGRHERLDRRREALDHPVRLRVDRVREREAEGR